MNLPSEWLIGALWTLTMALAGSLGTMLYRKVSEMAEALEDLTDTVHKYAEQHARVEERLDATIARVDRLERYRGGH